MEFDRDVIRVPGPEDPWFPNINEFALTFNGYMRLGDFEAVAKVSDRCSSQFQRDGKLPWSARQELSHNACADSAG